MRTLLCLEMYKHLNRKEKIVIVSIFFSLCATIVVLKREVDIAKKMCKTNRFGDLRESTNTNKLYSQSSDIKHTKGKPNFEYEKIRRRLKHTLLKFSFLFETEIKKLVTKSKNQKLNCTIQWSEPNCIKKRIQKLYKDFKNSMLNDFITLKKVDGFDEWRIKEFISLSNIIQNRFHHLQNPPDCSAAKKVICRLHSNCGFGCELHHLIDCMMASYFTGRTFTLDSKYWHYNRGIGWEGTFQPVSETCADGAVYSQQTITFWPGFKPAKNIEYPYCDSVKGHYPFEAPNLPHDIYSRLIFIHDNPHIWWAGQFLRYLLRYQPKTVDLIEQMSSSFSLKNPMIGLHVRRSDKKLEAPYRPLIDYMDFVEEFYEYTPKLPLNQKKNVFMATDDINVLREARQNFSNYDFLTDPMLAQLKPVKNYKESNFNQTVFNLHVLSRLSTVVCTLSSNFCRLVLELSAGLFPDEKSTYYSLDAIYTWPFGKSFYLVVHIAHKAMDPSEISFEIGDIIHQQDITYNFVSLIESIGYLNGLNVRTKKYGKFPAFKAKLKPTKIEHPNFNDGNYLFDF